MSWTALTFVAAGLGALWACARDEWPAGEPERVPWSMMALGAAIAVLLVLSMVEIP